MKVNQTIPASSATNRVHSPNDTLSIELNSQPAAATYSQDRRVYPIDYNNSIVKLSQNKVNLPDVENQTNKNKLRNSDDIAEDEDAAGEQVEVEDLMNPPVTSKTATGSSSVIRRINTTSNILEDEYFGEDTAKKAEKRNKFINPDAFNKLRDHHVQWDSGVFIEILWYHIFFYLIAGPFINIIYYKRFTLMKNLQFWGKTPPFFIQTLIYFFNILILSLYFSLDHQNIYMVEILFTNIIIILRSYVIACKYATLHPDKMKLYRNYFLEQKLTSYDYYLTNWVSQDSFTLYRETYNALQRGEFDPAMFYMAQHKNEMTTLNELIQQLSCQSSFFVEPSEEVRKQLIQINDSISVHHKYTTSVYQPDCLFPEKSSSQYFGYSVLGFIIRQFIQANKPGGQFLVGFIIAFTRTAVPIAYRYIYSDKFMFTSIEIVQLVAMSLNCLYGYFTSFVFLLFFIRDLRMKNYILTQCKLILQVKKVNMSEQKILPTIDIVNINSLKAWSILRRVSLDYGKQYGMRLQAYLTIYLFTIIITSIILMLWILKVYNLDSIYPIMCLFELLITFSTLLYILFWGALVNESFPAFQNTLGDHKVLFLDLLRMREIYFKMRLVDMKSNNFVVRKSIQKIKLEIGLAEDEYDDAKIQSHLNALLAGVDDCEFELEQDFRTQPFTIFGIKINLDMFKQLCVAVFTLAAGVVQVYLLMNGTIKTSQFSSSSS